MEYVVFETKFRQPRKGDFYVEKDGTIKQCNNLALTQKQNVITKFKGVTGFLSLLEADIRRRNNK